MPVHWTPSKVLFYQVESITWFSISSDSTQICFCDKNEWNCTKVDQSRRIYPDQDIEVSAIAVETGIHMYQKTSCMKQEETAPAEIILCHQ